MNKQPGKNTEQGKSTENAGMGWGEVKFPLFAKERTARAAVTDGAKSSLRRRYLNRDRKGEGLALAFPGTGSSSRG